MAEPLKSKNKTFRVIVQLLILVAVAAWVSYVTIERGFPKPQRKGEWVQRSGFLALSYGGLSRDAEGPHMHRKLFREQLEALGKAGYEAVTTRDIVDFYYNGAPLPDRAVYLMFEGGRRDSAIYGQEGLIPTGMRATMYVHTGLMSTWNRTFLSESQLGSLGHSRFWDVGSAGHEVYLPAPKNVTESRHRFFLADFQRDANGNPTENIAQFAQRARRDYDAAITDISTLTREKPASFVFMPANSLGGGSLDPGITDVNQKLIADNFQLAFTREGVGYNHRSGSPLELTRLRVPDDCTPDELLNMVNVWMPSRSPYVYRGAGDGRRWRVEMGGAEFLPGAIRLEGKANESALTWLTGSENWRNLAFSAQVTPERGEQGVYFRYGSREAFVRVRVTGGMVQVQERLPGKGLLTLFQKELPKKEKVTLSATLRNSRLRLAIDGVDCADNPIPVSHDAAGRLALEGVGGTEDFNVAFADLSVRPMAAKWRMADRRLMAAENDWLGSEATAVMASVGNGDFETDVAAMLLRAADAGMDRYGILPRGELGLDKLIFKSGLLPEKLTRRLWTGVVFTPERGTGWRELAVAAATAGEAGLRVALRLEAAQAGELTRLGFPIPANALLVEEREKLPRDVELALRRTYGEVLFVDADGFSEKAE